MHPLSRGPPHTPEGFDRESSDEVQGLIRVYRAETIRLAGVGGHLGEELIVRHARRSREPEFVSDALTDLSGYLHS